MGPTRNSLNLGGAGNALIGIIGAGLFFLRRAADGAAAAGILPRVDPGTGIGQFFTSAVSGGFLLLLIGALRMFLVRQARA